MTVSMYDASVPVIKQMLTSLSELLAKAEAHTAEKKIEPAVLLQARLFPDMLPLTRQVQIACDFGKSIPSRLAGVDVPAYDDTEQTFEQLQARIARTLGVIAALDPASFTGSEAMEIVLRPGTPKERTITGQSYLFNYGLPQFFFHIATAYALLRHNGVEVGKKDYMGVY